MEDLGHFHIMLKCRHPYSSSENIDFRVEPGFCVNGWNYNLDSYLHGAHIISKHNPQKCFVLTHKKYNITLRQWLDREENQNNWSRIYQRWGVNRPKEEARQIIQGILRAVYELHLDGSFHGFLYHPENFAIQYDELVIGGDHKRIKRVFLLHEKGNESSRVLTNNEIELGKKNDMLAVSNVIFNQIIKGRPLSCYPQDLRNLRGLLEQQDVSPHNWKRIVNHPSLWHWKSRFCYTERVWMQFQHAKQSTQNSMKIAFSRIQVQDWVRRIPDDTPLQKVFGFKDRKYRPTPEELLRYLRNVYVHYKDGWRGNVLYLDEQIIEHMITQVSELFLVDLYNMMCKLDIEI